MARDRGELPWWLGEEARHVVCFVVGIGLGAHEVLLQDKERPFVLGFIVSLIGVPVYGMLGRIADQVRGTDKDGGGG